MKKITFLFWNIGKKDVRTQIENLVELYSVDILILAENDFLDEDILKGKFSEKFAPVPDQNGKIQIFSKQPLLPSQFTLIKNEPRYTIRLLNFDGFEEMLLVALHLPSKINNENNHQSVDAILLNINLAKIEKDYGIDKTVVIGDFNMHPFDYGMVSHAGFNSVMTRKIARKGGRRKQSQNYSYFYNPMWGFLGDLNERMPGTSYRSGDFNWHLFDQLLIRPSLIQNFDINELEIVTGDGENSFLNKNGRIRSQTFSDHLPIKFSLNY